jgi:hypothetical protein
MKVLHAGVGTGKSVAATIDWLLDVCPCEPDWPIFKSGVKFRPYRGPWVNGGVAVVSYELKNHENTLWPQVIRRWVPLAGIQDIVTGKKTITFRNNPCVKIYDTPVFFVVSSQSDTAFVSAAWNLVQWDEQSTEDKFNNANARVRRRDGRHVCSLTPHSIEGRADTGAGSYLDRIRKGELDVGLDVEFFKMKMSDCHDWVYRETDKKNMIIEWESDPIKMNNRKKLAEGRAILYGEFHERSGLVFDDFDPAIHVIEPFEVPPNWSFYRYHDHGRKEPNACALVAVSPENDYFICGEYYESGKEISDNARGIIEEMTGNELVTIDGRMSESMKTRDIIRTVSDPRSVAKALDNSQLTIGEAYIQSGLYVFPGSAQHVANLIPLAAELLAVDMKRKHFITKELGAPRVYIFNTLRNFLREMGAYKMKVVREIVGNTIARKEVPVPKNDHLMTCLLLLGADRPMYIPKEETLDNDEEEEYSESRCGITGY